ncbi:MAG: thioesterase domain-containing protein, partial [Bacteroidota bacterium]|nr:thioesterase domain-containing protein [Bacteroidota bacterium]
SMGALLAAETARLLEAALFQVELILLDNDPLAAHATTGLAAEAAASDEELVTQLVQAHLPAEAADLGLRARQLLRHNLQLLRCYRPALQLAAPMLLLEAADSARPAGRMRNWQQFTSGPVQHRQVPGDHFSLLDAAYLPGLTQHILEATSLRHVLAVAPLC